MENEATSFCPQCGTPVLQDARFCSRCGFDLCSVDRPSGKSPQTAPYPSESFRARYTPEYYDSPLRAVILFHSLALIISLMYNLFTLAFDRTGFSGMMGFVVLFQLGVAISATVADCILLHHWWAVLPPGWRRMTPGKAVGYLFIPIYGLYWAFVAYGGLADDLNRFVEAHGMCSDRASSEVIYWSLSVGIIAVLLFWIPIVSNVLGIAAFILYVIFAIPTTRICKAIGGVLEA